MRWFLRGLFLLLWTIRVSSRASIIKKMTPFAIATRLHVIAVGFFSKGAKPFWSLEVVGAIDNLNVSEIA